MYSTFCKSCFYENIFINLLYKITRSYISTLLRFRFLTIVVSLKHNILKQNWIW